MTKGQGKRKPLDGWLILFNARQYLGNNYWDGCWISQSAADAYRLICERDPRHRSSKDTKRWCRGKIGVEHDKVWRDHPDNFASYPYRIPYWTVLMCAKCGREFERTTKKWSFPALIRAIREASGMTQERLGQKAGIAQEVISRLESENNPNSPTLDTVRRLAEAFGLTCVLDFWGGGKIAIHKTKEGQWL